MHSSLSALGEVPGGADAVIDALLAALGGGTLVLPTLSYLFVSAEKPDFDVKSTPTNLGAIPSAGLRRAGAVRSLHPTHSCVAIGPRAAEVCGEHWMDRTPVGPNSPFTRVKELGGQVAFVGCPHLARCNTSMHGVEEALPSGPPPYLLLPDTVSYVVKGADGVAEAVQHRRHNFAGTLQRYERVVALLEASDAPAGSCVRGKVLRADAVVMDAREMWRVATAALERDRACLTARAERPEDEEGHHLVESASARGVFKYRVGPRNLLVAALLALLALSQAPAAAAAPAPPPASLAWPLHGSEGDAGVGGWASSEVPVGAHWPFGAMRLGADTSVCWAGGDWWLPFNHYGGYFYNDTCVRAFSHVHAQGAGLGDGGVLGISLARAAPAAPADLPSDPLNPEPWRTAFAHGAKETSVPGYYSVGLPGVAALAEVTVSGLRAGLHRYTCSAAGGAPCVLVADACHRTHDGPCGPGTVAVAPQGDGSLLLSAAITEKGAFAGDCGGVPVFIVAAISAAAGGAPVAPAARGLWADGALLAPAAANASSTGASGSLGAWAAWPAPAPGGATVVLVRVALSYVSLAAAAANLAAEQQGGVAGGQFTLSFEQAAAAAHAAWDEALSAVVVNDVGYTSEDVAEFRRSGRAVPGAPEALGDAPPRVEALAREALRAWRARSGAAAGPDDGAFVLPSASERRAAAALNPMPPLQRLGSFYSSLYHVFAAPSTYSDAAGTFTGLDRATHSATWRGGAGVFYSDFSLWDVYRTQMPLLAALQPVVASDIFNSMMAMFAQTNYSHVPHWVWANCETGCMPGSHGLAVLADFLTKGIAGPNASDVYRAAAAQLASQDAQDDYNTVGFVPVPDDGSPDEGASLTLEYAFDDFVGSVIASAAGEGADAARWLARSKNYKNVFNPSPGAICPRFRNGSWPECPPLDLPPILLNKYYTEGDGLQWTFSVPHDVDGLVALFPTPGDYIELLQQMMQNTTFWGIGGGSLLGALPNPWLWVGNEPSLLLPFQFNWVPSNAWRTQYWVRWTLDTYFQLLPDGVPGNDDFGATNGWAVWACLGLYPVTATSTYTLSSPCFANVTMQVPASAARLAGYAHAGAGAGPVPLVNIVAHNFSVANVYVASASLNGVRIATPFVSHNDLFPPLTTPRPGEDAAAHAARVAVGAGPTLLEFTLSPTPSAWQ